MHVFDAGGGILTRLTYSLEVECVVSKGNLAELFAKGHLKFNVKLFHSDRQTKID